MKAVKALAGWAAAGLFFVTTVAPAADDDAIQRAIDRGVAALKKLQKANGEWSYPRHGPGATALAGLTLLECGVPATDPAVVRAVKALRPATPELVNTYSLALAILFLDRLGDPGDVPLIQSMTVRLLAGQDVSGGWTYECPPVSKAEVRRLKTLIQSRREPVVRPEPAPPEPRPEANRPLPLEIQNQLHQVKPRTLAPPGDNSNTKFATLALWVARRHGMPVEQALARVETRFRGSQNGDGGWGYTLAAPGTRRQSFGTMTCSGLLGLAMGHFGAGGGGMPTDPKRKESLPNVAAPRDLAQDAVIRAGLLLLGRLIGGPIDGNGPVPLFNPVGDEYYFLWALERVAVAYGLPTIGNQDWYAWGAELLLTRQRNDGHWEGQYGASVDTCFALLFLRRANLSADLSARLKGQVADPGKVTLTTGGVGGQGVEGRVPKTNKPSGGTPSTAPARAFRSDLEAEAAKLAEALVKASGKGQDELLTKYRQTTGVVYTQALAAAIPQLRGEVQGKTRDALAERLARMTAATLQARLKDEDGEMRRAAARACALKADLGLVPDLINLLDDPNPAVARAAHAALKDLADNKDFGPAPGANEAERRAAVTAWKNWWSQQKK